ncbi:MAG: hypothetical protein M1837_003596 [Sclerophora amabilis]|nr:MAG: hypothetical protein M1837_003596 [Sclerophora amabilis]
MRELPASSEHLMGGQTPELAQSPVFQKGARHEDEESEDGDLDSDEMDHTARLLRRMSQESGDQRHSEDEGHKQNRRRSAGSANGNADRAHEMRLARRPSVQVMEQQQQRKMLLQCLLLEAGILFHSVFIGMALSVATGTSFIVLLVAISFHQTFEGIALGSRIAAITSLPPTSPKPWLMALAYGTTTPFGQAIGLLVHNLYDPASQTGLLLVGLMNAISSGLLLFAGLVELLAEDFLSDKSYETLKGRKRIEACGAVVGGAMLMAFVGAFA